MEIQTYNIWKDRYIVNKWWGGDRKEVRRMLWETRGGGPKHLAAMAGFMDASWKHFQAERVECVL